MSNDKDNVPSKVVPGEFVGPPKVVPMTPKPSPLADGAEWLRKHEDILKENAEILARLARARYEAAIRAGFDEKQALELCTKQVT